MVVTLFSVRFVFQQQRDDESDAKGDDHADNVVQQRAGLHDGTMPGIAVRPTAVI